MYGIESIWTDARIDILKALWVQGLSASRIAAELGGISRNAAIGKAHRLGLPKRVQVSLPRAERQPRVHKRQRFREVPPMKPLFEELRDNPPKVDSAALAAELFMQPISLHSCTLMELTPDTCRFPLWRSKDDAFLFCGALGADMENDRPYCEFHHKVCHQ